MTITYKIKAEREFNRSRIVLCQLCFALQLQISRRAFQTLSHVRFCPLRFISSHCTPGLTHRCTSIVIHPSFISCTIKLDNKRPFKSIYQINYYLGNAFVILCRSDFFISKTNASGMGFPPFRLRMSF